MKPSIPNPTTPRTADARETLLVLCVAIVVGAAAFSPSIMSETFVGDSQSPLRLSLVSHARNIPTIFGGEFMTSTDGQYRPLSYALLALARTFVPVEWTPFWHAWLVLFLALNATLVYRIVRRLAGTRHGEACAKGAPCRSRNDSRLPAALAGGVFLLHPLASIFGNQLAQFHHVLATTLFLAVFLIYLAFSQSPKRTLYAWMLPLFAAGLFTSKTVAMLPLFLLVYELGARRTRLATALLRTAPFAVMVLAMVPCWTLIEPNMLHYAYPQFDPGVGWYSFVSAACAAPRIALGFLGGWGIPAPLAEVTPRLSSALDWDPALNLLALGLVTGTVLWSLRRHWAGLGFLLMLVALVPWSTTTLNRTEDFVSWNTLCLPLAGFAVLTGGLLDALAGAVSGTWRRFAAAGALSVLALFASVLVMGNAASRSAASYWARVLAVNPSSETASVSLGRALLAEGRDEDAMRMLFSPNVTRMAPSSTVAAAYYARRRETLAAALHLRYSLDAPRATYDEINRTLAATAAVTQAMGALDWTEDSLGQIVMRAPYEAEPWAVLAELMSEKGYTRAAARMIRRATELEPGRRDFVRTLEKIDRRTYAPETATHVIEITPQSPEQLQFALGRPISPRLRASVIRLADVHPEDPLVQLEAGIQLAVEGQKTLAYERIARASNALRRYPYAWAARCWLARELGRDDEAWGSALRVLGMGPLDAAIRRNILHNLGYLADRRGRIEESAGYYRAALALDDKSADAHNGLAGVLLRLGKFPEALRHLERAAALGLETPALHNNMGHALLRMGRPDEALQHLRTAVELEPQDVRTHRGLAGALASLGRFAEAKTAAARGLVLFPQDEELAVGMARILSAAPDAELRNGEQAVALVEPLARKSPEPSAELLDVLGAAYAEAGRFGDAETAARRAVAAATRRENAAMVRDITARLRLYQTGRPYRLGEPK